MNKEDNRKYSLSEKNYRQEVDLREFAPIIKDVVVQIVPEAKVTVEKDAYYIEGVELSRSQTCRIGRRLAKSSLGQYSKPIYSLFRGENVYIDDEEEFD